MPTVNTNIGTLKIDGAKENTSNYIKQTGKKYKVAVFPLELTIGFCFKQT